MRAPPWNAQINGETVGAASSFTLAATAGLSGHLVLLDPQNADETNRNRLLSAAYDDVSNTKARLAAGLFTWSEIKARPYVGNWPDYTIDPDRETPKDIRIQEQKDRFEWVLSCVDRNIHRRNIAVYLPRHIIGGSTNGWRAQVAYYSLMGQCQCLGCDHPVLPTLPTEELRRKLLGMSDQQRTNWYERHDADSRTVQAIEEYLNDPGCGTVGATELARLGRQGETDWAVGFVSVAAGVLQAAWLLQAVMRSPAALLEKGSEVHAWFARPGIERSFTRRKVKCDLCADEQRQRRFRELWTL